MHPVELILGLIVVTGVLAFLAARLHVPYPIFLVVGGGGLSLIPNLPRVELQPDIVFLLFLPPLLYYAGMMTSWRDFVANRRAIGLLAVGCTLFTTGLVAAAAVVVFGMGWAPALVLGAIVSPPDAVAATAIMAKLRIPKRIITILEGESLVNDATALVAYKFAVAAVVTGAFSLPAAVGKFGLLAVGGVAVGYVVGVVVAWVRPRLRDESAEAVVSLMTPYLAYLPAEHLGTSGVLAAVTAGIYLGRRMSKITRPRMRLKLVGTWEILIFLLNALVFILIGLQLREVVGRITDGGPGRVEVGRLVWGGVLISLVAVAVRMLWVYPATYLPRRLFPAVARHDPAPPAGWVFMVSWTGMRGIVSLAAALALPTATASGAAFVERDVIVFLTFGVILFTLVVQGLSLPLVIRWLGLGDDGVEEHEEVRARYEAAHAAMARIETLVALGEASPAMADRLAQDYRWQARELGRHLRALAAGDGGVAAGAEGDGAATVALADDHDVHGGHDHDGHGVPICETVEALEREAIDAQRRMVVKLRDDGAISDEVLRRILTEIDLEESRLHEV